MKKRILSIIAAALLATIAMPVAAAETPTILITSNTDTQIPNPFVACDSLQEAAKLTGFPLAAPETLRDYPERSIHVMDHKMIQVSYQNAQGKTVTLRKAAGSGDISGDFRQHTQTTKETIAGISATVKRTNARAYVAIWNQDGYTYSIQSSHGLDNITLQHLIQAKNGCAIK